MGCPQVRRTDGCVICLNVAAGVKDGSSRPLDTVNQYDVTQISHTNTTPSGTTPTNNGITSHQAPSAVVCVVVVVVVASHPMLRRAAVRRPFLSSAASLTAGVAGYATWIEWDTAQLTSSAATATATANSPPPPQQQQQQQQQWSLWTTGTTTRDDARADHSVLHLQQQQQQQRVELPRQYDGQAIRTYWSYRPIATAHRAVEIASHLLPLGAAYVRDFVLRPRFESLRSSTSTSTSTTITTATTLHQHHAVAWRDALTALGPAFVKAGQQISIRPDLIPAIAVTELQQLCDAVPPFPDAMALDAIQRELSCCSSSSRSSSSGSLCLEDVFYETPVLVAAASLGQVYKARLRSNNMQVAIKVQRPDMLRSFSLDLYLLQLIGSTVDMVTSLCTKQPPFHAALYDSFCAGSYAELDYEHEAANQEFFRTELAARQCPVVIPRVVHQYSTRTVLVTEWMDGIRLSDAPPDQIKRLIPVGVELFLTQLLDIGRFHSDPHVGNLLVLKGSGGAAAAGQLCLLDFGLCTVIAEDDRRAMTAAIWHLLQRDFDSLVHVDSKALGFLPESFDTTELLPLLTKILTVGLLDSDNGTDTLSRSNRRHRHRRLREISAELNEIFFTYPFSVPPFFALVTRGLGLLEGIALSGDADFDIFQAAAPYARRRALQLLSRNDLYRRPNATKVTTTATAATTNQ